MFRFSFISYYQTVPWNIQLCILHLKILTWLLLHDSFLSVKLHYQRILNIHKYSNCSQQSCQELWWVWDFLLLTSQSHNCWQETWDSWFRHKGFCCSQHNRQHGFHVHVGSPLLLTPSLWEQCDCPDRFYTCNGTLSLGNSNLLKGPQQTCTTCEPEKTLFLLSQAISKSVLFSREDIVFSKAVHSVNILEKIIWNISSHCLCSQNLQKCNRPMENCLSQYASIYISTNKKYLVLGKRMIKSRCETSWPAFLTVCTGKSRGNLGCWMMNLVKVCKQSGYFPQQMQYGKLHVRILWHRNDIPYIFP